MQRSEPQAFENEPARGHAKQMDHLQPVALPQHLARQRIDRQKRPSESAGATNSRPPANTGGAGSRGQLGAGGRLGG